MIVIVMIVVTILITTPTIITVIITVIIKVSSKSASSKSARCVWHKACLARLAWSEHHKADVSCSTWESQTAQCCSRSFT